MEAIMPQYHQSMPKVEELLDRRCFAGPTAAFLSADSWGTKTIGGFSQSSWNRQIEGCHCRAFKYSRKRSALVRAHHPYSYLRSVV